MLPDTVQGLAWVAGEVETADRGGECMEKVVECCVGRDCGDAGGDGAFECADGQHGVCSWGCQHCCCDTHLQGAPLSSTSIWIAVSVYAVSHQQNVSVTIITTRTSFPNPRGFHVAHPFLLPPANNSRGHSSLENSKGHIRFPYW